MNSLSEVNDDRITFHSWGFESLRFEAQSFLEHFDCSLPLTDINDVIEIYNVYKILHSDSLGDSEIDNIKNLYSIVTKFYKDINDNNFALFHQSVYIEYYDDFLTLFDRLKSYKNVSPAGFSRIFLQDGFTLYKILEHKGIVSFYDETISEYMLSSDQTAEIIIRKFLEDQSSKSMKCYIPQSLDKNSFEEILDKYIDMDQPRVNLVNLISYSQSSVDCPISDELRKKAKHRAQELFEKIAVKTHYSYGFEVKFAAINGLVEKSEPKPGHYLITYNSNWFKNNTDLKSILYIFIHVFSFTDQYMRCNFPVVSSQLTVLEKHMGIKGIREYKTGYLCRAINHFALATISLYYSFLNSLQVNLESFIQDFFCNYLNEEFSVYGFDVNMPLSTYSDLDKCRILLSEMDGILKQFTMFVRKKHIDMELYEMSSSPIAFKNIPSLIPGKYAYANGDDIQKEMILCFSDQSMLSYVGKYSEKKNYDSFVSLINDNLVRKEDYPGFDQLNLQWLMDRGTIKVSEDGLISLNYERVAILKDLYDNDVIRTSKYQDNEAYQILLDRKDLVEATTLFSKPEQQYINYMLNKKEYSNGKDLRNKYIHGSYPRNKEQHFQDYMELMRIMIVVIIKINEEFCYWYDSKTQLEG